MTLSAERTERDARGARGTTTRALVRVAAPLDDQANEALHDALIRVFKRPLELDIEVRPDILGGVWVRVGDTVIDGSLTGKLEALRHHLRSQCQSLLSAGAHLSARELKP